MDTVPADQVELVISSDESMRLQTAYVAAGVVGTASENDAAHIAVASIALMDIIVSWNLKHIAHYEKILGYEGINTIDGYRSPRIYSPYDVITAWKEGMIRLDWDRTKTAEARIAPMTPQLKAFLEVAYTGQPLTETVIRWHGEPIDQTKTAWDKACERAGLPGFHIHDLRRTAVRNMVRAGIDQRTAMMISGHKTIAVFHRYNIVDERDLKASGVRLGAVHGGTGSGREGTVAEGSGSKRHSKSHCSPELVN